MLRGMSAIQWLHWKAYMSLAPFGEERDDIRAALVAQSIWNVQIAKAQGAWDASKRKHGSRPVMRPIDDFVLRFGDTPERQKMKPEGRGVFDSILSTFESMGLKPVKK